MSNLKSALAALEPFAQATATPSPAPMARANSSHSLPSSDEITVANAYLFINDDKYRRYVVNFQLFTETNPFTPHKNNAAFLGTAILRAPYVFENVMTRYKAEREGTFPHDLWEPYYVYQIKTTLTLPSTPELPDFPVIGQLAAQGAGTRYELGSLARAHIDPDEGLKIDLMLMDGTIPFTNFTINPERPRLPRAYASYDPYGLWVSKQRGKRNA